MFAPIGSIEANVDPAGMPQLNGVRIHNPRRAISMRCPPCRRAQAYLLDLEEELR
jgi:hypothetical protein